MRINLVQPGATKVHSASTQPMCGRPGSGSGDVGVADTAMAEAAAAPVLGGGGSSTSTHTNCSSSSSSRVAGSQITTTTTRGAQRDVGGGNGGDGRAGACRSPSTTWRCGVGGSGIAIALTFIGGSPADGMDY